MIVLGDEFPPVIEEDSSSASGVNGGCTVCCLGAMEVPSESIVDAVEPSTSDFEGTGDGDSDLLLGRLTMEDPSSTVTGFGFILTGVLGLDRFEAPADSSPAFLGR